MYSLTHKFNDNLESVLADDRHSHILKVQVPMDADLFDNWGRLNANGRVTYWHSVDQIFRDFDRNKFDLQPHKMSSYAATPPLKARKFNY